MCTGRRRGKKFLSNKKGFKVQNEAAKLHLPHKAAHMGGVTEGKGE